jgi:hypothetical protein
MRPVLEALDWNISRQIIHPPQSRKALSGSYAELIVSAFELWA